MGERSSHELPSAHDWDCGGLVLPAFRASLSLPSPGIMASERREGQRVLVRTVLTM